MYIVPFEVSEFKRQLEERLLPEKPVAVAAIAPGRLGIENIAGIGIGQKYVRDQPTGEICVKVCVVEKVSPDMIEGEFMVPPEETIKGVKVKTDVDEVGEIEAYSYRRTRLRPCPAGVSLGHKDVTAGTFGCVVTRDGRFFILSNNHVLANCNKAQSGDPILQPGPYDGGQLPHDTLAYYEERVDLKFGGPANKVDTALVRPVDPWYEMCAPFILQIGEARGVRDPFIGMKVKKRGRTTRYTEGEVDLVDFTVRSVRYGKETARFIGQIRIKPVQNSYFSQGGDSGSLILDQESYACGLLFAGSVGGFVSWTYANPIKEVLSLMPNGPVDIFSFPW